MDFESDVLLGQGLFRSRHSQPLRAQHRGLCGRIATQTLHWHPPSPPRSPPASIPDLPGGLADRSYPWSCIPTDRGLNIKMLSASVNPYACMYLYSYKRNRIPYCMTVDAPYNRPPREGNHVFFFFRKQGTHNFWGQDGHSGTKRKRVKNMTPKKPQKTSWHPRHPKMTWHHQRQVILSFLPTPPQGVGPKNNQSFFPDFSDFLIFFPKKKESVIYLSPGVGGGSARATVYIWWWRLTQEVSRWLALNGSQVGVQWSKPTSKMTQSTHLAN